jgi:hypothetical protein
MTSVTSLAPSAPQQQKKRRRRNSIFCASHDAGGCNEKKWDCNACCSHRNAPSPRRQMQFEVHVLEWAELDTHPGYSAQSRKQTHKSISNPADGNFSLPPRAENARNTLTHKRKRTQRLRA